MNTLYISAAHKSSGKTTISLGLCSALRASGKVVQSFKKGPDYIDPLWLAQASGRPCYNLDFHTQSADEIVHMVGSRGVGADVCLVEGNKGLFDGLALDGHDSNAALSCLLDVPVVLVIDTRGITRGIAPLLCGYRHFDENVKIGGVILNYVGGERHEGKLRQAVEYYTDIPVLGAVRKNPELEIDERHLGLIPSNEMGGSGAIISRWGELVSEQVDLHRLLAVAGERDEMHSSDSSGVSRSSDVRIAIARDAAFGFYYPDDLEAFRRAGASLVPVDLIHDARLPDNVDGLFIGGGFPETSMRALSENSSMRADIKAAVESGMPVYAECGGLMYLAETLVWQGEKADMCSVLPVRAVMNTRPQGRGTILLKGSGDAPWSPVPAGSEFAAHEFHYASLHGVPGDARFAWSVMRGHGIDGRHDGIVTNNLVAGFAHLRQTEATPWVDAFVDYVRARKGG